jgi:hypothetical protein
VIACGIALQQLIELLIRPRYPDCRIRVDLGAVSLVGAIVLTAGLGLILAP